ncbi:FtsX-like permease family protein [Cyclobacterium sp. 1_MG-2023]|uniref:ABC transporter permease n=1 Tax=Cyclobacterium sp. 1_MG-2023 TaxID=3062681 RepID=UPI0026E175AC|nr:FtsX-like permease family protein [Cyclobacterium sp. 1_MG-2023]MDO6435972.1 FtsX-like permease family protein [Cyclobacterium sp. 1_MG-2023]
MKLSFQLAFRNLIGAGLRTWLIVGILTFTFLVILFYNGLLDGWNLQAKRDAINWEFGYGQFQHKDYDPYDPFSLQNAHGVFDARNAQGLTPLLMRPASIFPNGRMLSVTLKGLPKNQRQLKIPVDRLDKQEGAIPVAIGKRMAKTAKLSLGDEISLRWRDKNGTFDAENVKVAAIFNTTISTVDQGQIWMRLEDLWRITGMNNEATIMIADQPMPDTSFKDWNYVNQEKLLQNINNVIEIERASARIIYFILLAIALLAIFDTQVLSVFRRQKEIGTYIALGMTKNEVTGLFTLEGSMYSLFSMFLGTLIGVPLFGYLSQKGISFGAFTADMGIGMGDRIYPSFSPSLLVSSALIVIISATIVSFIPARKIVTMNPIDALKGKLQ